MIRRFFFLATIFAVSMTELYAQDMAPRPKKFDHYIGVQANQLIKQLINLSNNNAAINNPYLLTYGIFFSECGYGLQAGIGYNYQQTEDKIPINRISKIDELFYRIGVGRKIIIGKKWQLGYGLDVVASRQFDKTTSSSVTDFGSSIDSSSSVSSSLTTSLGYGAQVNLAFHISEKIMLSTEATYYYSKSKVKQNVFATDKFTNSFPASTTESSTNSNTETDKKTFSFSIPVALFLVIKF